MSLNFISSLSWYVVRTFCKVSTSVHIAVSFRAVSLNISGTESIVREQLLKDN